ncbi:MAG TPA: hypothetical protein PK833_04550 [Vicingus sp.]|nr:MAG: hypothetical protein F9K09_04065 [Flavobacteriales bacterium]HRP59543.1 hypothetical protein [Vicingus sp.]
MKLKLSVLLVAVSIVFACKNNREENTIKIDQLIYLHQQIENKFMDIDSVNLFLVYTKMTNDLKEIHYFTDSMDVETVNKITQAYQHLATFTEATQQFPIISTELIHSKKQLNNFKQDVSVGLIETAKFHDIYNEEQQILLNLNDILDSTFSNIHSKMIETENNYPIVDSIVEHFKQIKITNSVNQ